MSLLLSVKNLGLEYRIRRPFARAEVKPVLHDISFDVYQGECIGVIGRNGAGKSSLLKVLAGIIDPNEGEVVSYANTITLLSLQAGFNPELSGRFNAIMNGMLMGFSRQQMEQLLPQIIAFSELGPSIDRPVKTYSAGMRTRLGFSTAIQLKPDILLVDEVLAVGDVNFREKSMAAMREKLRSDQTVIMVSHQANVIRNLCDRAIWIEDGICRMTGTGAEVIEAYESYVTSIKA